MSDLVRENSHSRFSALDILRGLAIFGMGWSGTLAYKELPAWMYHAQLPPPSREFNDKVFGITWVDLVFPFFLFAMGAAIPLALQRRLQAGETIGKLVGGIAWRGVGLAAFALFGEHFRPYTIEGEPSTSTLFIGLWAIVVLGLIFLRYPAGWPRAWKTSLQIAGWILAALTIRYLHYPDGRTGFFNDRLDIILMVLANVAVSGSLIWLITRKLPWARWIVIAVVAEIFLGSTRQGLAHAFWEYTPMQHLMKGHWPNRFDLEGASFYRYVPIVYHFEYHKYLLIVLPATFAGDLFLQSPVASLPEGWGRSQFASILWLGPIALIVTTMGLLAREITLTTLVLALMGWRLCWAVQRASSALELRVARFVWLGLALLAVGMVVEPLGGGIRKDEATLSYFFVTSGLAFLALASLSICTERYPYKSSANPIELAGRNPIIGYIAITNLLPALHHFTFIGPWLGSEPRSPWVMTSFAFFENLALAFIVAWCTRKRIFFRA